MAQCVNMLVIDGHGGNPALLRDEVVALELLQRLPRLMGMTVLREPTVLAVPAKGDPLGGGVTGDVWITTSHIALHTAPALYSVWFDAFSCRLFDPEPVRRAVIDAFGLSFERTTVQAVERDIGEFAHAVGAV